MGGRTIRYRALWGFGGFVLAQVASKVYDKLGHFTYNYYGAAVLLVIAAFATFALKSPHVSPEVAGIALQEPAAD